MKIIRWCFIFLCFFPITIRSQQIDYNSISSGDSSLSSLNISAFSFKKNTINWDRAAIGFGALTAINALSWNIYLNTWYHRTSNTFQFRDDWYDHSLNVDKLGHFWTTTVHHKIAYKLARGANFSKIQSLFLASSISWLEMLPIEIKDGYFLVYGFSFSDLAANTLGAMYPSLQMIYPSLQSYNIKMSMHLTSSPGYSSMINNPIDDYEGRTFWLSVNIHELLPAQFDSYWPDWLCIAVGYGGDNMFTSSGIWNIDWKGDHKGLGTQEWYIALDYDLMKLFKPDTDRWYSDVLEFLNKIHFPAPTIRFKPNMIAYGLYF